METTESVGANVESYRLQECLDPSRRSGSEAEKRALAHYWRSPSEMRLSPAGRRNDSVHAEVFHHLAIVIVRVGHRVNCELKTRVLP